MPARWPWVERTFCFDFPVGKFPDILSRFRGTPARIEEFASSVAADQLTWRDAPGTWSIQENIGHLLDLEALWARRVEDFLRGEDRLSPADINNPATHAANHNARPIAELLGAFRAARGRLVARLEALDQTDWAREAIHPRLNQKLRLVDAIAFTCDHDDYHLARAAELAVRARGGFRGPGSGIRVPE
ncbi:MAG: DinB family protein [Pyrinomonadaceae bacterium]|nr:DinB family protein [Phycisphaerales bacterium]